MIAMKHAKRSAMCIDLEIFVQVIDRFAPSRLLLILAIVVWTSWCSATVRRVPDDFATIQSALNAVQDGDTVLVDVGFYAEALIAPPLHFCLVGNVPVDTGDYPRPTIDPSFLPGADTLACLILPLQCQIVIENFAFINGPQMYPRPTRIWGGIVNQTGDSVTLRACVFDSTFGGIQSGLESCRITLDRCSFRHLPAKCAGGYGLKASDCFFSGLPIPTNSFIVSGLDSSLIERCHFAGDFDLRYFGGFGHDIVVRDCVFGPCNWSFDVALQLITTGYCLLENSVFADLRLIRDVIHIQYRGGDCPVIRNCSFISNSVFGAGGGGITVARQQDTLGHRAVLIEDCLFDSCVGNPYGPIFKVMWLTAGAEVRRNRFVNLLPLDYPSIESDTGDAFPQGARLLRENILLQTGYAIEATNFVVDARWNYWGDSSGPFHPVLNPDGLGDMISDNVLFDPWYPDTSFLSTPRPHVSLPLDVSLDVYPNPFNATATLKLVSNQPGIFQLDLYNTLGQHVRKLWSGAVAYEKEIMIDGASLPSGIYFARVWQVIGNRPVAIQKVAMLK